MYTTLGNTRMMQGDYKSTKKGNKHKHMRDNESAEVGSRDCDLESCKTHTVLGAYARWGARDILEGQVGDCHAMNSLSKEGSAQSGWNKSGGVGDVSGIEET
jgi:hypothetical protein